MEYVYFVAKSNDGFLEMMSDPYGTKEKALAHWKEMPENYKYIIVKVQF